MWVSFCDNENERLWKLFKRTVWYVVQHCSVILGGALPSGLSSATLHSYAMYKKRSIILRRFVQASIVCRIFRWKYSTPCCPILANQSTLATGESNGKRVSKKLVCYEVGVWINRRFEADRVEYSRRLLVDVVESANGAVYMCII